ncbi:MAG: capsule biosynthesis protein, partial [Pseudomonadota bacterium]
EIEVRAFAPQDAQNVARAIIGYSSEIIEELSRIAREDAMRYTLEDLAEAEERLKAMRVRIREFRNEYQIIDPEANVESQAGIVSGLESELVASLIELATIERVSSGNDPRVPNIELRIEALREQIAAERAAISTSAKDGRSLTDIIGEYEELLVDLQFSQNAYTAALAAEENARFEANRRSRYLAVHIPPTLAEESIYPARASLVIIVLVCSFAAWSILTLGYYNARDRS